MATPWGCRAASTAAARPDRSSRGRLCGPVVVRGLSAPAAGGSPARPPPSLRPGPRPARVGAGLRGVRWVGRGRGLRGRAFCTACSCAWRALAPGRPGRTNTYTSASRTPTLPQSSAGGTARRAPGPPRRSPRPGRCCRSSPPPRAPATRSRSPGGRTARDVPRPHGGVAGHLQVRHGRARVPQPVAEGLAVRPGHRVQRRGTRPRPAADAALQRHQGLALRDHEGLLRMRQARRLSARSRRSARRSAGAGRAGVGHGGADSFVEGVQGPRVPTDS